MNIKNILILFLLSLWVDCQSGQYLENSRVTYDYEYDACGALTQVQVTAIYSRVPMLEGQPCISMSEEWTLKQSYQVIDNVISELANFVDFNQSKLVNSEYKVSQNSFNFNRLPYQQPEKKSQGFYVTARQAPRDTAWTYADYARFMALERHSQMSYRMSYVQKCQMMNLHYEKFVKKLLTMDLVSTKDLLNLWQEYKAKRWWNKHQEKDTFEKLLIQLLQDRDNKRAGEIQQKMQKACVQKKEEVERELLKKREHGIRSIPQYLTEFIPHEVVQQRADALKSSVLEKFKTRQAVYDIAPHIAGYMNAYGFDVNDYAICSGTSFNHQLHQETINLFDQATIMHRHQPFLGLSIAQMADGSCAANKRQHVSISQTLADLGWALLGIPHGIGDSVISNVMFPYHLAKGIGKALVYVVSGIVYQAISFHDEGKKYRNDACKAYDVMKHIGWTIAEPILLNDEYIDYCSQDVQDYRDKRAQGILQTVNAAVDYCNEHTSTHDKIKFATRLLTDYQYGAKVLHATIGTIGMLAAHAKYQIHTPQFALALAEGMEMELGAHQFAQEIVKDSEIEQQIEQLVSAMKSKVVAQATPKTIRSSVEIIEEIQRFPGGEIPRSNVELIKELKGSLKILGKKASMNTCQEIINSKTVRLLREHIFSFEFDLKKGVNGFKLYFQGGHTQKVWAMLQEEKYVQILSKNALPGGLIEYQIKNLVTGQIFTKTVFNEKYWSATRIKDAAYEIYKNPINDVVSQDKKTILREGVIDNVSMHIIFRVHDENTVKESIDIKNFLPYKILDQTQ